MLHFADESDRVTGFLTSETIKKSFIRVDRKRWRFFGVERAQATPPLPDLTQRDILRHNTSEIGFDLDSLKVFVVNSHRALTLVPVGGDSTLSGHRVH